MKTTIQQLHAGILIMLLLATPAAARTELPSPNQLDAASAQRQTRSLRLLRITVSADQSVNITTEGTISDAVSYISGDRYVVVIPQAVVAGINSDVV
ncbi:MAG TPA: hypothetical protein VF435_10665, partial [Pyrinomonadaceae bacterium]